MPKIQFNLSKDLDDKIKHFMIDNNIIDKRFAICTILEKYFIILKTLEQSQDKICKLNEYIITLRKEKHIIIKDFKSKIAELKKKK